MIHVDYLPTEHRAPVPGDIIRNGDGNYVLLPQDAPVADTTPRQIYNMRVFDRNGGRVGHSLQEALIEVLKAGCQTELQYFQEGRMVLVTVKRYTYDGRLYTKSTALTEKELYYTRGELMAHTIMRGLATVLEMANVPAAGGVGGPGECPPPAAGT
jgi:hypothetical protein